MSEIVSAKVVPFTVIASASNVPSISTSPDISKSTAAMFPAKVAFSLLSNVRATASADEVILTAVAIMSFTSAFLSAESVASRIIIKSPATGCTAVSPDIPVAGNVLIVVCE